MFSCEFCETFQKIFLKECKYFERLLLKPVTNRFLRPYETIATVLEQNEKGYVLHGNIYCVKSVQIRSFFRSVFSRIRTVYGEILRISPYSIRMRENMDQKKIPYLDTFHAVQFWILRKELAEFYTKQKQPSEVFYQRRCSKKNTCDRVSILIKLQASGCISRVLL